MTRANTAELAAVPVVITTVMTGIGGEGSGVRQGTPNRTASIKARSSPSRRSPQPPSIWPATKAVSPPARNCPSTAAPPSSSSRRQTDTSISRSAPSTGHRRSEGPRPASPWRPAPRSRSRSFLPASATRGRRTRRSSTIWRAAAMWSSRSRTRTRARRWSFLAGGSSSRCPGMEAPRIRGEEGAICSCAVAARTWPTASRVREGRVRKPAWPGNRRAPGLRAVSDGWGTRRAALGCESWRQARRSRRRWP